MTTQRRDFYDQTRFRVWPDGTVQEADQSVYPWMSDDHTLVWAYNADEALIKANVERFKPPKLRINWGGVVLVVYLVLGGAALAVQAVNLIKWAASKL